jgi:hypothetical protein
MQRKQAWMSEYQNNLESEKDYFQSNKIKGYTPSGVICWDTVTYLYNLGFTPNQAIEELDNH